MGYEIRVKRSTAPLTRIGRALGLKVEFYGPTGPISKVEWLALVETDPDLVERGANVVWTGYPDKKQYPHLAELPIWWDAGELVTQTPPPELIEKLAAIARRLSAFVVGEEGEEYHLEHGDLAARACRPWALDPATVRPAHVRLASVLGTVLAEPAAVANAKRKSAKLPPTEAKIVLALVLAEVAGKIPESFVDDGQHCIAALAQLDPATVPMLKRAMKAPDPCIATTARAILQHRRS
jgi:hypothetical protein